MAKELIDAMETLTKTVQGIRTDFDAFKGTVDVANASHTTALKAVSDDVEKRLPALHRDDSGQPIGAPAIIKGEFGKSSRPLMLINVVKAYLTKDWSFAKEEHDISERLSKSGYSAATIGGVLFPIAPELMPDDLTELREEVSKRMALTSIDAGELAYLCKRFPAVAKLYNVQKDLALGNDTLGGYLVPTTQSDRIIDLFRNRSIFMRAGATEIPLPPGGNTTWPKLNLDPTFTWGSPDRTGDIATSDLGFDVLRLRAKECAGAIAIPNTLIRYSSPAVEMIARTALADAGAVAEDLAFLEGAGSDVEPKGLTNYGFSTAETSTRGKVTLHVANTTGASGDTFDPEDVATMMALYEESNDPDQPTAWVMRPRMWSSIKNRRADAVSAGDKKGPFMFPISRGDMGRAPEKRLDDVSVVTSLQAKADRVKSATNLTYIILGNFRRWTIARSGAMELAASEHVRFLQDQTVIKAIFRVDAGPTSESSFVLTDTLLQS
jgi:HK97 family phage major capsid protein